MKRKPKQLTDAASTKPLLEMSKHVRYSALLDKLTDEQVAFLDACHYGINLAAQETNMAQAKMFALMYEVLVHVLENGTAYNDGSPLSAYKDNWRVMARMLLRTVHGHEGPEHV